MSLSTLRLREHRERLGLTQAEVAERLVQLAWARERVHVGVTPDMVSKWERGIKLPSKLYQRLLCLTFDASPYELGLVLGAAADATHRSRVATMPGLLPATAPAFVDTAMTADVMRHVWSTFDSLVEMDQAAGSRLAVGAAAHEASILERLCMAAVGPVQRDLQVVAARFAELTGWLLQDLGDLEGARHWSERGMDLAVMHGDRALVTYMLMRRSTVAAERGDVSAARAFAEAAVPNRRQRQPTLTAVGLRANAVAYSLSGDSSECARALSDAQEVLVGAADVDHVTAELAPYCTPAYLAMEAGRCWLNLGQPTKAVAALETAVGSWPDGQERDRSLALARLATAYLDVGEVDLACSTGEQARALAVVTGSARVTATLTSLGVRLAPHSRQVTVTELRRELAAL